MNTPRTAVLVLASALTLVACDNEPPRKSQPRSKPSADASLPTAPATAPATTPSTPAGDSQRLSAAGLSFPIPDGWARVTPSNSMRLAQLESGACVAAFSTAGGGVDMNIDRWIGQFQNPDGGAVEATRESKAVGGVSVHLVEMSGTYLGMGRGAAQPDQTMRAAIYETPGGLLFIKMTGPTAEMDAVEDGWNALIDGTQAD